MLEYCIVNWLKKRLKTWRVVTIFQFLPCRLHTVFISFRNSTINVEPVHKFRPLKNITSTNHVIERDVPPEKICIAHKAMERSGAFS